MLKCTSFGILFVFVCHAVHDMAVFNHSCLWHCTASFQVTIFMGVPSLLETVFSHATGAGCTSLRLVISGGEALMTRLLTLLRQVAPAAELCNIYGPTECTIWCTNLFTSMREFDESEPTIPIGNPAANQPCYVLDPCMRPCPIGVPGELFIGGAGVARGYAKRPELTAERFLPDPFSKGQYKRMYRTGDLVRWLPDGNLVYMGRLDHQVKLRGFRIELSEVEAQISRVEGVVEVAVIIKRSPISLQVCMVLWF